MVVLYVDDLLIASNDEARLKEVKEKLSQAFQMKDLGEPEVFLGMKITRDREKRIMTITQTEYTRKIIERFRGDDVIKHDTPMITRQVKNRDMRNALKEFYTSKQTLEK